MTAASGINGNAGIKWTEIQSARAGRLIHIAAPVQKTINDRSETGGRAVVTILSVLLHSLV
jgi:hypothetical protein